MFKLPSNAIAVIKGSLQASLKNTVTFPEHVKTIASVGVTRYEVDLRNYKVMYHLADGTIHTETLPSVNSQFNSQFFAKIEVKAAITDIQKQTIDYTTFLNRIVSAGTKSYGVNIDEGKVIYQGEDDNYIEEFPKLDKG